MTDKQHLLKICNDKTSGPDFIQAHIYRQLRKIVADHDSIEDIKAEVENLRTVQNFLAMQLARQGQEHDVLEIAMFSIFIYDTFLLYIKRFLP